MPLSQRFPKGGSQLTLGNHYWAILLSGPVMGAQQRLSDHGTVGTQKVLI